MKSSNYILFFAVSAVSAIVHSQEKGSLPVRTFELTPTLNVSLNNDSNVARTNSDEIESWVSIINPQLTLGKQIGENSLLIGVNASKGDYHSSAIDNYTDYQLFAKGGIEFDRRNRVSGSVAHASKHDSRGEAYSTGAGDALTTLDEYSIDTVIATYSFGAITASANIDLNIKLRNFDYDVDILEFNPSRLRDRKEKTVGSTFYYGISPTIDLLVDAKYLITDYAGNIENIASFDSKTKSLLVGAKWETTAASSGFAKIGYQKRDFEDTSRVGFSGVNWEAGIAWNPIERAIFEFSSASDTQETYGQGNYIRRKDYVIEWRHEWLERFGTDAKISYADDSYEGGSSTRNDKIKEYRVGANYQFRRWLKFITSVSYFDKDSDSTNINFGYNRTLVNFTAQVSL